MALKVPCSRCGVQILPSTAEKHSGLCVPCANGTRAQIEASKRSASEEGERQRKRLERLASAPLYTDADALFGAIASIADAEDESDLETLEIALRSLANLSQPEAAAPALLGLLERFPWSDGFESFWSIVHELERMTGYEPLLIASVRRSPGEFNLLMINRLLNSGITGVAGTSLLAVLHEIAERPEYSERARESALRFLKHQSSTGRGPARPA
jgi:hypothetical protein